MPCLGGRRNLGNTPHQGVFKDQWACGGRLGGLGKLKLLQIHVQLHAAQGAAVAAGVSTQSNAAAVAHAAQGCSLQLAFSHFQAEEKIRPFAAFFTA